MPAWVLTLAQAAVTLKTPPIPRHSLLKGTGGLKEPHGVAWCPVTDARNKVKRGSKRDTHEGHFHSRSNNRCREQRISS